MKLQMTPDSPATTPKLSGMNLRDGQAQSNGVRQGSKLDDFRKYIDAEKGWITFEGAATITNKGVNFSNGKSFHMSLDEVEPLGELGKGNYGTVYKVRHARPSRPRFGQGLSGFRGPSPNTSSSDVSESTTPKANGAPGTLPNNCTGVIMAMKEIRLELDEAKFTTILKELVILHECVSPYIIDFYGAFFQEGAVYMCIEYMDGGSIDKLYTGGIPEDVLRRITYSTIMGLKTLKDDHNIIHRDVKPTNILINRRGQVKICDFGVSGNLVASKAKTNIGCQSYMAPERISIEGMNSVGSDGTYSVQSDIWSLGLTVIECALGRYPYPPEAANTIFSQLSVSSRRLSYEHHPIPGLPPSLSTHTKLPLGHRGWRAARLAERGILAIGSRLCPRMSKQDTQGAPNLRHAPQAPLVEIAHGVRHDQGRARGEWRSRGRRGCDCRECWTHAFPDHHGRRHCGGVG